MKTLTIGTANGKNFTLPLDAVTQTFGILAKKGNGKSYTASVMAEEMLKANQQIVAIDPTGAWHGLRSSADGKSEGFPIVVFGGDRGSLALNETAGEIIATAIVEHRFSAVLDLSLLRKGAANRFIGTFLETLYRLNRDPLHLFVDEADAFAPQKTFSDESRTLGAMEDIVRRGRIRGIGCTLISQRPQVLNKNVLTQVETLITGNLSHPKDIGAIEEWIDVHAEPEQADVMVKSLPSLPKRDKWVWSPEWLGCFERITVRPRETFDSGATPKPGQKIVQPKKIAPVDIKALGEQIASLEEQRKADDPKELKKKLADLQKQLTSKPAASKVMTQTVVDQKSIDRAVAARDKFWQGQLAKAKAVFEKSTRNLTDARNRINDILGYEWPKTAEVPAVAIVATPTRTAAVKATVRPLSVPTAVMAAGGEQKISAGLREIMIHLAQNPNGLSAQKIGARTGIDPKLSTFRAHMADARKCGWIDGGRDCLTVTSEGLAALGHYDPLPDDPAALQQYWLTNKKLSGGAREILYAAINAYPEELSREEAAAAAKTDPALSTFRAFLAELRNYDLIGKAIRASDNLFD